MKRTQAIEPQSKSFAPPLGELLAAEWTPADPW